MRIPRVNSGLGGAACVLGIHQLNENATIGTYTYHDTSSDHFWVDGTRWMDFAQANSFAKRVIALFVVYKLWIKQPSSLGRHKCITQFTCFVCMFDTLYDKQCWWGCRRDVLHNSQHPTLPAAVNQLNLSIEFTVSHY